jgi:hypothetical protein
LPGRLDLYDDSRGEWLRGITSLVWQSVRFSDFFYTKVGLFSEPVSASILKN